MDLVPQLQGASAEAPQQARSRVAFHAGWMSTPVANRWPGGHAAGMVSYADVDPPQRFISHPQIRYGVESASIGYDVAWPHLPGRIPPAGWDGEPGAGSPSAGML